MEKGSEGYTQLHNDLRGHTTSPTALMFNHYRITNYNITLQHKFQLAHFMSVHDSISATVSNYLVIKTFIDDKRYQVHVNINSSYSRKLPDNKNHVLFTTDEEASSKRNIIVFIDSDTSFPKMKICFNLTVQFAPITCY